MGYALETIRRGQILYNFGSSYSFLGKMSIVTLSSRGRITLPAEIRAKINATRFLIVFEGNSIRLIPLSDPLKLKGSIKIPWNIEELEEASEGFLSRRVEG